MVIPVELVAVAALFILMVNVLMVNDTDAFVDVAFADITTVLLPVFTEDIFVPGVIPVPYI